MLEAALLDAARSGSIEYALNVSRVSLLEVVSSAVAQMQAVAAHRGLGLELRAGPGSGDLASTEHVYDIDAGRGREAALRALYQGWRARLRRRFHLP